MEARLRYFCFDLKIGLDYARALEETGLGLRVIPVGGVFLVPTGLPGEVFSRPIADPCINVVCSEASKELGERMTKKQWAPADVVVDADEVAYYPQTAFDAFRTVGIKNVAIVVMPPLPDEAAVATLKQYDAIITPEIADARLLRELGVPALGMAPEPDQLTRLLGGMVQC